MLTANQLAIQCKVAEVLAQAKKLYPACTGLEIDRIVWKEKGRAVGMASFDGKKFFLTFTKESSQDGIFFDDTMKDTVAHEVAHLVVMFFIACRLYGNRKIQPHGKEWRHIAITLGCNGKRCHNLPVTAARAHTKYLYRLDSGLELIMGKKYHMKIMNGLRVWTKKTHEVITSAHYVSATKNGINLVA
jgi:SprT protein